MLTLAIDTATRWGRFALAHEGRLLVEQPHNVGGSFADAVMPVVEQCCAAAGRRLDEVAVVAVTRGPGSFTGIRIAVATAKALAYALDARLVAVPTTAAMAAALLAQQPTAELAVPALDARRGEIFAAVYRRQGAWTETVVPPAPHTPDDWWARLCDTLADVETPVYGGDGTSLLLAPDGRLRDRLSRRGRPQRRLWSSAHPSTAAALACAGSRGEPALATISPFALVPLYLRGSDAEVARHIDMTPRDPSGEVDVHISISEQHRRGAGSTGPVDGGS